MTPDFCKSYAPRLTPFFAIAAQFSSRIESGNQCLFCTCIHSKWIHQSNSSEFPWQAFSSFDGERSQSSFKNVIQHKNENKSPNLNNFVSCADSLPLGDTLCVHHLSCSAVFTKHSQNMIRKTSRKRDENKHRIYDLREICANINPLSAHSSGSHRSQQINSIFHC